MAGTLELPRLAPLVRRSGLVAWIRVNLFANWTNSILTILLAYVVLTLATKFLSWAFFHAVWTAPPGDSAACRAMRGQGACWALIGEKHRFMLFATYPYDEQWRPALSCLIVIGLYAISAIRRFWTRALLLYWVAGLAVTATLMWGGIFGLLYVSQQLWGGLPVTLLLATIGIASALPIGVVLALGRQARDLPVIRALCIGYIELIRGVPLVSLLFMASFLFPLFMPQGISVDKLLRAQIAFTMFAAAYLAEVVRGGLQGVRRGQFDAADALGLGYWTSHWYIILPQALRSVIPSLVNTSISMFKSTSLVLIIGLFDLLNAGKAAIVDPLWQAFGLEMFIAISLVYFVFCFSMSKYSQHLEARLGRRH
jgi:general L-amino acid transport system permease protein